MRTFKNKAILIAVIACVLAVSMVGVTIAYFTDTADTENTFTFGGGVKITLTEKNTNGSYDVTAPGQQIEQYPTITNVGADSIYVASIITLENTANPLSEILSLDGANGTTKVTDFLSGGAFVAGQTEFLVKATQTGNVFTVYIIRKATLAKDASVKLFDGIKLPAGWDSDEVSYMTDLKVTITAYATQTIGFENAEKAINGAFGGGADSTNSAFAGYFASSN